MKVDLFLFMGQSNMAGRGTVSERWPEKAVEVPEGWAYEYRVVSAPDRLSPLKEPFGEKENRQGGINDVFTGGVYAKTGSMVSAFCKAYYERLQVPIVGVSASKGGSHICQWQPDSPEGYLSDALQRYRSAADFLDTEGHTIRHRYLVWCQGESDGDLGTTGEEYKALFHAMLKEFSGLIENCFLIQTGDCNIAGEEERYREIQKAQLELCDGEYVILVSEAFQNMQRRGLMKDAFHYYQQGYNECGKDAGEKAAEYVLGRENKK